MNDRGKKVAAHLATLRERLNRKQDETLQAIVEICEWQQQELEFLAGVDDVQQEWQNGIRGDVTALKLWFTTQAGQSWNEYILKLVGPEPCKEGKREQNEERAHSDVGPEVLRDHLLKNSVDRMMTDLTEKVDGWLRQGHLYLLRGGRAKDEGLVHESRYLLGYGAALCRDAVELANIIRYSPNVSALNVEADSLFRSRLASGQGISSDLQGEDAGDAETSGPEGSVVLGAAAKDALVEIVKQWMEINERQIKAGAKFETDGNAVEAYYRYGYGAAASGCAIELGVAIGHKLDFVRDPEPYPLTEPKPEPKPPSGTARFDALEKEGTYLTCRACGKDVEYDEAKCCSACGEPVHEACMAVQECSPYNLGRICNHCKNTAIVDDEVEELRKRLEVREEHYKSAMAITRRLQDERRAIDANLHRMTVSVGAVIMSDELDKWSAWADGPMDSGIADVFRRLIDNVRVMSHNLGVWRDSYRAIHDVGISEDTEVVEVTCCNECPWLQVDEGVSAHDCMNCDANVGYVQNGKNAPPEGCPYIKGKTYVFRIKR